MTLEIRETFIDADKGHVFSESDWYEPYFADQTRGEILKALRKEYGRCVSKIYIDTHCGTKERGYVFQGRQRYEDTNEPYLREVWVHFRDLEREEYDRAAKRQQVDIG